MRGRIVSSRWLGAHSGLRELWLEAPEAARRARPGQFLHVRAGEGEFPLLRRALTPLAVDREGGRLRLVVRPGGRALSRLALRGEGEEVDFLGPLGRPFPLPGRPGRPLLVAEGGAWLALAALARELGGRGLRPRILLLGGFDPVLEEEAAALGELERLAAPGRAPGGAEVLARAAARVAEAAQEGTPALYAAGSERLLRALREVVSEAARRGAPLPAWVALEGVMACGIGSCLGCAVLLREPEGGAGETGPLRVARLCSDGPVFELERLVLGETWPEEEGVEMG